MGDEAQYRLDRDVIKQADREGSIAKEKRMEHQTPYQPRDIFEEKNGASLRNFKAWQNDDKRPDTKDPDFQGRYTDPEGRLMFISMYLKDTKTGKRYITGFVKEGSKYDKLTEAERKEGIEVDKERWQQRVQETREARNDIHENRMDEPGVQVDDDKLPF